MNTQPLQRDAEAFNIVSRLLETLDDWSIPAGLPPGLDSSGVRVTLHRDWGIYIHLVINPWPDHDGTRRVSLSFDDFMLTTLKVTAGQKSVWSAEGHTLTTHVYSRKLETALETVLKRYAEAQEVLDKLRKLNAQRLTLQSQL